MEAVDSKGIFRKIPSVESVAALVLLEGVVARELVSTFLMFDDLLGLIVM